MSLNTPTHALAGATREAAKAMQSFVLMEAADRLVLLAAEVGRLNAENAQLKAGAKGEGAGVFGWVHDAEEAA